MKEGYKFKDKLIILRFHLKTPLHLLNYLLGIKNSRRLYGNVFIKNRYGLFFCGNNFSSVFGVGSMSEPIVRKELIIKKGVMMDIGANCGMFTIPTAKMLGKNGRVISIEPDKKNIKLLKKNVGLNNLKNVDVIEKGVFSKKGKMTFYLDDIGTGGHSLLKSEVKKKEIISVDTIDNTLSKLKINHVDLIKIDVEGVEIEAFKGAKKILKKSHPKIIFEALSEHKREEIYKFLNQYGYKIKKITDCNYVAV
ncbi:MAG: FkbM family methyltransferase [archaeon]